MYDPLWAAAQDLGMPLTLHLATGRRRTGIQAATDGVSGGMCGIVMGVRTEIMDVLGDDFIFGGILDRFPRLDIVCAEFEISWIPFVCAKCSSTSSATPPNSPNAAESPFPSRRNRPKPADA